MVGFGPVFAVAWVRLVPVDIMDVSVALVGTKELSNTSTEIRDLGAVAIGCCSVVLL